MWMKTAIYYYNPESEHFSTTLSANNPSCTLRELKTSVLERIYTDEGYMSNYRWLYIIMR